MTTQARLELTAVDKTKAAFDSANRSLESIGDRLTRLGIGLDGVGASIAGLFSVATIGSMVALTKSTADFADEMGKAAQRAGTGVEEFSALAYAANLADVSQEDLGKALKKLSVEIEGGGKELKAYGINAKTADQALLQLADRIAATADPTKRVAIAAEVLGERFGPQMVTLLAQGSRGLKDAMEEAQRFGVVVNTEAAAAAEKFNDNLTRLGTLAQGLKISLTNDLVQGLGNATEAFLKANKEGGKFAAILAGIQTFLTGDARHKANVSMVENAARIMEIQNAQDKLRNKGEGNWTGQDAATWRNLERELEQRQAAFRTAQSYAKQLDDAAAGSGSGGGGGKKKDRPLTWTERRRWNLVGMDAEMDAAAASEDAKRVAENSKREAATLSEAAKLIGDAWEDEQKAVREWTAKMQRRDHDKLIELLGRTPGIQLERDRKTQQFLADQYLSGVFGEVGSAEAMERYGEVARTAFSSIGDAVREAKDAGNDFGQAFSSALEGVFLRTKSVGEAFRALGANILSIGVQQAITNPAGKWLGDQFKSLLGFEGGGFTGYGPRTGGMDGRGGFLAMLHPNETVVDHTRGQRAASVVYNLNTTVHASDNASKRDLADAVALGIRQAQARQRRAEVYGG